MLRLNEVYKVVITEGQNEQQARNFLNKYVTGDVPDELFDYLINTFKEMDPTEQNKYLSILAGLYLDFAEKELPEYEDEDNLTNLKKIADEFKEISSREIQYLPLIEQRTGAKLQYSREKGAFFNKRINISGITSSTYFGINRLKSIIRDLLESFDKIDALKKSKKESIKGTVLHQIDNEDAEKMMETKTGVSIYYGNGSKACANMLKGTSFCIKDPKQHRSSRSAGSTFYIVYGVDEQPADVIIIKVNETGGKRIYDTRNEEDNEVYLPSKDRELSEEEFFIFLKEKHNIEEEVFQPIPQGNEEMVESITNGEAALPVVLGEYVSTDEGEIIDLTDLWIRYNEVNADHLSKIRHHKITKNFYKDYVWTALMSESLTAGAIETSVPAELANKYIIKLNDKISKGATNLDDLAPKQLITLFDASEDGDNIVELLLTTSKIKDDGENPRFFIILLEMIVENEVFHKIEGTMNLEELIDTYLFHAARIPKVPDKEKYDVIYDNASEEGIQDFLRQLKDLYPEDVLQQKKNENEFHERVMVHYEDIIENEAEEEEEF